MELSILLNNNIVKKYTIDDVLVMEQYPGRNSRWDEIAIIFKDSSILWEGGCFTTYVIDGNEFITDNRVNTGGGYMPKFEEKRVKISSIKNYFNFVKEIQDKLTLVTYEGTFQDQDYYFVWENTSS
jgi:hypothetical protein